MLYPYTKQTAEKHNMVISSDFGYRKGGFHDGVDFAPSKNRNDDIPIIATVEGKLLNRVDENGGKYCYIQGNNGQGHLTVHHRKFLKKNRSKVKVGDEIALMGSTGNSTGVHVHFEVRSNYGDSSSSINPNPFEYLDTESEFEKALRDGKNWQELMREKYNMEIMSRVDQTHATREELLIMFHRFSKYIQKSDAL